ncbi:MAG: hypothetical protein M3Y72_11425 [Acidobacteriota bacterium]|nr:hypothetical protein [Acidobacteriota bacterium]
MVDRILCLLIPERARFKVRKIIQLAVIAFAAAFFMLCPVASAQKPWDAPRVVTWNCSGCHGIDGNAQAPYFPRLGGLNAAYAEKRMAEFRAADPPHVDELFYRIFAPGTEKTGASALEARINMIGIAHAITAEEMKASAGWYAMQKPARGRSGNPALIQRGEALFLKGSPAQGLIAFQTAMGRTPKVRPKSQGSPVKMRLTFLARWRNSR